MSDYPIQLRGLEIVLNAPQGLEELARGSSIEASSVSEAMTPIIFEFERVLECMARNEVQKSMPTVEGETVVFIDGPPE